MKITPAQIIGYKNSTTTGMPFYGYDPTERKPLPLAFSEASAAQIEESVALAQKSFSAYRKTTPEQRALFLEAIATQLEALGDELLTLIAQETALPLARLTGERGRTTGQLKLFAQLLRDGKWNVPIVDEALPDRKPLPRPHLMQVQVPLGPVVVFGASNFPLAFSVAGGDTVAALAAGCPVVFKAHPAHPSTCQLVGEAIAKAAQQTGMPEGVFSMLHGFSHEVGGRLVTHPFVKAVAFTGSFKGGKALYDLAVRRKEPIPVYAEMGSVNPVFFLPAAVKQGGETLATQFAASVTQGTGQFCTNPGVAVFVDGEESKRFIQQVASAMSATALHPMLTQPIADAYQSGIERQKKMPGASPLIAKKETGISPSIISVAASHVLQHTDYFEEVFGPSTVAILTKDGAEMHQLIDAMPGQLTATVHTTEGDDKSAAELIERLTYKVGRVVMNAFPTGVEVCHAMVHGGPYPATTDSRATSVGTTSIYRFTRPVCYQGVAKGLLPAK